MKRTAPYAPILLIASATTFAAPVSGQDIPALEHGPHVVGFRVIEALDSTRAFRPRRDFRGELAAETARPVQVSIWYPAQTPSGALPGPYPVVLYLTGAGVSNSLLPAYLASHGFVVASFSSKGRMTGGTLEFTPNALTLDTDIDDAGFVYAVLRRLPYVDSRRLALVSFSGGSLAALLWQMRDMQAASIATIEGWERFRRGAEIIAESVHYDPRRVRVPLLMIERGADEASPLYAKVPDVVDSLRYADRMRVAFRDAAHADFLSHVPYGHTEHHAAVYGAAARFVRLFLQATLNADAAAAADLARLGAAPATAAYSVRRNAALAAVPTEEELYRLAETDPALAAAAYRAALAVAPGAELFREQVLTRAATFAAAPAARIAIMEIVVDAYPSSTAARFNLGRALADGGRTSEAATALRDALRVAPEDPALDASRREAWRARISSLLAELRTR